MAEILKDKVAVITGAASGIGRATVELFVAEGARVLAADIDDEGGQALEDAFPGLVRYQRCDVTSEDDIAVAMEIAGQTFGGIDVLFNNAGAGGSRNTIETMTGEAWDVSQSLLLRSVVLGMRYALPYMKGRPGASIVNTASIAGLQVGAGSAAYSAAKAGVIHLTRVAAAEFAKYDVRVNAICPGLIVTNIFSSGEPMSKAARAMIQGAMRSNAAQSQPVRKVGEGADIAQTCLYLASPMSAFVTGTHIVVDGGLTIGPRHSWDAEEQARRMKAMEALRSVAAAQA